MKRDFFTDEVREQFNNEGNSMYETNSIFISENIKGPKENVLKECNFGHLYKGSFYFIYYDLTEKTSMMEKLNPVLLLDYLDINNIRTYFVLNINFLPITIRVLFYNEIFNQNLDILKFNIDEDVMTQKPLNGISFQVIYNMLKSIGFEWAIRKLEHNKINKIYKLNTNYLVPFITMSTARFTKVNDSKLIEIWKAKIKDQDERHKKVINDLLNSYDKMKNEFSELYTSFNEKTENLRESIKAMSNF